MITALVVPARGARVVVRAKKVMSAFIRGHGSVPRWPIPRRVWGGASLDVVDVLREGDGGLRTGVVATIRVRGGFWGGILFILLIVLVVVMGGGGVWKWEILSDR